MEELTKELSKKLLLVARFHGWKTDLCTSPTDPWCYFPNKSEELKRLAGVHTMLRTAELKYHQSWEWLMPVIEKIEALGHAVEICENTCIIYEHSSKSNLDHLISISGGSKIFAAFENVVQFVEIYNRFKEGKI